MSIKIDKTYLGDGVYAEFVKDQLIVTTEDGFGTTNKIVLEPEIMIALTAYATLGGIGGS